MLGLGLGLNRAVAFIRGIVRKNLQLWLDFEKSEVIGGELITNGDFATDTDWNLGTGWSYGDDEVVRENATSNSQISQVINIESGSTYSISYTREYISGGGQTNLYSAFTTQGTNETLGNYSSQVQESVVITSQFTPTYSGNLTIQLYGIGSFNGSISNISVKEITQFAKDKSPNTNNAKLFTGKALSFGGNDYVDLGSQAVGGSDITIAVWGNLNDLSGTKPITAFGWTLLRVSNGHLNWFSDIGGSFVTFLNCMSTNRQRIVLTQSGTTAKLYINGVLFDAQTAIVIDNASLSSKIGSQGSNFYDGDLADLQIYNAAWNASDVTFDYNNPNHLVTDNPNSTISLSNLKGYWALSEGDGVVAFDSSGEGNSGGIYDGAIFGATYVDAQPTIPQLGMMDWSKGSNLITYSEDFGATDWIKTNASITTNTTTSPITSTLTADTFEKTSAVNTVCEVKQTPYQNTGNHTLSIYIKTIDAISVLLRLDAAGNSCNSTFTFSTKTFASSGANFVSSSYEELSNGWFKLSLVGNITSIAFNSAITMYSNALGESMYLWGAQVEEGTSAGNYIQTTDSSATDVTLIQNPNNKGFDILGNPLRLREHGFNLDGTGYGEVADDDSLDFGTGDFTLEAWVVAKYISSGSSYNTIISLGGGVTATDTAAIVSGNTYFRFLCGGDGSPFVVDTTPYTENEWYHLVAVRSGGVTGFYMNTVAQVGGDSNSSNVTNSSNILIGKDVGASRTYKDLIDEPRIYNRALTLKEIKQNFKAGINKHKATSSYSDDYSSDYGL